ncbi:UNVERIFIED_CONTAM: hypothetical protein Sradi_6692300 [Sesamum radiatum]|uniref:Metal-dependent protein hydrolase n=1 Tax=Sesamum radiatum TaxID=300843 RepID=A0AAW2JPA8_SESRA
MSTTAAAVVKRVGTHNGSFHCDEALGCFMIRLTEKFSGAHIVRTRDPQVILVANDKRICGWLHVCVAGRCCDAVLDLGGVYDASRDRYDHHQKGFEEVFGHGFNTKLSSAGLVYKHFGKEIIAKELQVDEEHPNVHRLFLAIYKNFIEILISPEKENTAFERAMALAGNEFLDCLRYLVRSWLPARSIVMECIEARLNFDPSGEIMVLTRSCPWKLHLFELEEEMKISPLLKYVIYQDDRSSNWRVQAVKIAPDKFESRKALPAQWRGLRDDELSKESGIPGGVFVHMSGFIGGNQTYEGALAMAKAALEL